MVRAQLARADHASMGRPSIDDDAFSRRPQPRDEIQQRALAGAVPTHQRDELSGRHVETSRRCSIAHVTAHASRRPATAVHHQRPIPCSHKAIVSAASTTRGPGTTNASLIDGVDTARSRRAEPLPLPERLPWSALRARALRSLSPISPASMITSGARRITVSIEILGYSGRPSVGEHVHAACDRREVAHVRFTSDGDQVGERSGPTSDDEQHP